MGSTLIGGGVIGIIGFLIAIAIMRAVFSISKIVGLLQVIAQELRARNLADEVYGKLRLNKENVKHLNRLIVSIYSEPESVGLNKPLK